MDKKIKTRWLKALRSGKYKQGKQTLRTKDGEYCCLGVLCDLYAKSVEGKSKKAKWFKTSYGIWQFNPGRRAEKNEAVLPPAVIKWAGIGSSNPSLVGKDGKSKRASTWNDAERVGFKGIANRIEHSL